MIDLNEVFQQGVNDYTENRFVEASEKFKAVLDQDPSNIVVWHDYGLSLLKQDKFVEAIDAFDIPIVNGYTESYLSRGAAYRSLGKYLEAAADFATCLMLDPNNANASSNLGNSLREFGMPVLALPFLNKALTKNPNDPTYRLNESVAHLLKGDLLAGWKNYDARWFYQSDTSFKPNLPGPEYDGSQDINDKIVCVYCEQGFGDSVQFIRFIKILQAKGAKILLVTRKPLMNLFAYNFPDIDIRLEYTNLSYHYHVPLMDLPKCLNISIDTIPYAEPYLSIKDDLVQQYKDQLKPTAKKRIGIVWSSNAIAFTTKFRQVPLESMLQAFSDYELVNIKYDVTQEEKAILDKYNVQSFDVDGLDKVAGLIKTLDAVVTVDTVYAHVAGALGIPTYVMLSDYGMDWRWFLNRTDSPFYNSVTVVRQQGNGDWAPVFLDISKQLAG